MSSKTIPFEHIALFSSPAGIEQLLQSLPPTKVALIVGASIRPQYISQMKQIADNYSIPYLTQPLATSNDYSSFLAEFKKAGVRSILSHTYSMLIRQDLLDFVDGAAANIHYSLLPCNRGPNPIQWAIIKDEKSLGTTIHLMNAKFDEGDIIEQKEIAILETDTWVSLMEKCHQATSKLLKTIAPSLLSGNFSCRSQDNKLATSNFRLNAEFPRIDFTTMSNREIFNLIRAQIRPLNGAYLEIQGQRIFIDQFVPLSKIEILKKQFDLGKIDTQELFE